MVAIENSVLVVAHPDDEILWFSSLLDRCKRVVVCFGHSPTSSNSLNSGRVKLMDSYPLQNVKFLKLEQSDAFRTFDWKRPVVDDGRLVLARLSESYSENTEKLISILAAELENESLVFTHNPWGEYGHEEHVQVFNAVRAVHRTMDFELHVNGYVSNRSIPLMAQSLDIHGVLPAAYPTNPILAADLKKLYMEHDCWTWLADYEWPAVELFYPVPKSTTTKRPDLARISSTIPLNYITHDLLPSAPRRIAQSMIPASLKPAIKKLLNR